MKTLNKNLAVMIEELKQHNEKVKQKLKDEYRNKDLMSFYNIIELKVY